MTRGVRTVKLGLVYSTKNQLELTQRTLPRVSGYTGKYDLHWVDGSTDSAALAYLEASKGEVYQVHRNIRGGADSAIAFKLTELLKLPYTHIGIIENDVLLDEDWFRTDDGAVRERESRWT